MSKIDARAFIEHAAYFWYKPKSLSEAMTANSHLDSACEMVLKALVANMKGEKTDAVPTPSTVYARAKAMFDSEHLLPFDAINSQFEALRNMVFAPSDATVVN